MALALARVSHPEHKILAKLTAVKAVSRGET
jgi:hypothetical protein